MWNRRNFLKLTITGLIGTTGILSYQKIYKHKNKILDIVEYPSPILRGVSQKIDLIDDTIIGLANSLVSILRYKAPFEFLLKGSLYKGLAAPQVGSHKRLIACGIHGELKILINPEILEKKGSYLNSEHCLSLPRHQRKMVKRSQYVKLKYKNLKNTDKILVAKNSTAALLEHEIDHLDGVLYIDHKKLS